MQEDWSCNDRWRGYGLIDKVYAVCFISLCIFTVEPLWNNQYILFIISLYRYVTRFCYSKLLSVSSASGSTTWNLNILFPGQGLPDQHAPAKRVDNLNLIVDSWNLLLWVRTSESVNLRQNFRLCLGGVRFTKETPNLTPWKSTSRWNSKMITSTWWFSYSL